MSTRERLLHILNGPEAHRIRFKFRSSFGTDITVNRRNFSTVASSIEHNRVHVQVSSVLPAGVGAQYFAAADPLNAPPVQHDNTILTPAVLGRELEGRALHECVHASYDLLRTRVSALDDEASAYVAHTLYYRMTNIAAPRWTTEIRAVAVMIADNLLRAYQAGNVAIPEVPFVNWQLLRMKIWLSPIYTSGPAGTGGVYTHNG
jgi:hypothetical protein